MPKTRKIYSKMKKFNFLILFFFSFSIFASSGSGTMSSGNQQGIGTVTSVPCVISVSGSSVSLMIGSEFHEGGGASSLSVTVTNPSLVGSSIVLWANPGTSFSYSITVCPHTSDCKILTCSLCNQSYCSVHTTHTCSKDQCPYLPECKLTTCSACNTSFCSAHYNHQCAKVTCVKGNTHTVKETVLKADSFQYDLSNFAASSTCPTCHQAYCSICGHTCSGSPGLSNPSSTPGVATPTVTVAPVIPSTEFTNPDYSNFANILNNHFQNLANSLANAFQNQYNGLQSIINNQNQSLSNMANMINNVIQNQNSINSQTNNNLSNEIQNVIANQNTVNNEMVQNMNQNFTNIANQISNNNNNLNSQMAQQANTLNSINAGTRNAAASAGHAAESAEKVADTLQPEIAPTAIQSPADSMSASSESLNQLKSKLLPSFSFFSVSGGDSLPSWTITLPLSAFGLSDFTIYIGGWDTVADGKLLVLMSFIRSLSIFVFALIYVFAIIHALRQW